MTCEKEFNDYYEQGDKEEALQRNTCGSDAGMRRGKGQHIRKLSALYFIQAHSIVVAIKVQNGTLKYFIVIKAIRNIED